MLKVYRSPSFQLLANSSSQAIENDLFTEDMSEFEKATAFVNAGRYPYSDAAVRSPSHLDHP